MTSRIHQEFNRRHIRNKNKRNKIIENYVRAFLSLVPGLNESLYAIEDAERTQLIDDNFEIIFKRIEDLESLSFSEDFETVCTEVENLKHEKQEILSLIITTLLQNRNLPNEITIIINSHFQKIKDDIINTLNKNNKKLRDDLKDDQKRFFNEFKMKFESHPIKVENKVNQHFEEYINNVKLYYFQTTFNKGVTSYNEFIKLEDRESKKARKIINNAIKSFKEAKLIKEDYKTTELLASCYNISGRSKKALPYYLELPIINPDMADAWLSVGNYYFAHKKYDKAVENLVKATKIEPENVEVITLISQSYDMLDDTENAIKAYEKAKAMNGEEKAFPYNLGLIYYKLVNKEGLDESTQDIYFNNIIDNFGEVIELEPRIKVPFQMKSFAEIQLKKYEDAVNTLRSCIDKFPEERDLWFNLGVAYTHLENKDESKKAFDKAEELSLSDN